MAVEAVGRLIYVSWKEEDVPIVVFFCLNKDILGLVFAAWWEEDWLVDFF
jgi:hypothetical protein